MAIFHIIDPGLLFSTVRLDRPLLTMASEGQTAALGVLLPVQVIPGALHSYVVGELGEAERRPNDQVRRLQSTEAVRVSHGG